MLLQNFKTNILVLKFVFARVVHHPNRVKGTDQLRFDYMVYLIVLFKYREGVLYLGRPASSNPLVP